MASIVVTGASRGLGLAVAKRLALGGRSVVAIARHESNELQAASEEIARQGSGALHFHAFDLEEVDAIPELVRDLRKEAGALTGLVNNAALGLGGLIAMMPDRDIERLVRLNVTSPIMLAKYVVRAMLANGGGRIVNITSIVATTGYSGLAVYGASKAALAGFTRSLARELGPMDIQVNAVAPGFLDTAMTGELSAGHREQIARRSALRRFAAVDDVAAAIEFLFSEGGRSITGTVLTVDAGSTA